MISGHAISYAQNREDILLEAFFKDEEKGFYVDIGGYDPDFDSVTKLFYLKGWTGINVEPQANRYELFVKKRTKDTNVNLGISDKNTTLKFRSYDNQGLSTFSENMKTGYEQEKDQQTSHFVESSLKVITLESLFKKYGVTQIQFMKVDVEGLEYEVLAGNDWSTYRPEIICIEANHIQKDWRKLLKDSDYSLVFFDGLNEYYADNKTSRAQKFDYVESVVFREPIVHFKLLEELNRYDETITRLERENKETQDKLLEATNEVHNLQSKLNEVITLRRHLKTIVRKKAVIADKKITSKLQPKPLADGNQKKATLLPVYQKGRAASLKVLRKVHKAK